MKDRTLADILRALVPPIFFVLTMALVFVGDEWEVISARPWGIRPKSLIGLLGIFTTPFLHGSYEHLFNNSIPILVLGWCLFFFYRNLAWRTLAWIIICGGFWVWVSGRAGSNHIGASGLVYGLASFLFLSGILRKHIPLIAISMLVVFLYGSLIWGVFPVQEHISWEGHLWGAVAGFIAAIYYRPLGPQRTKYAWEDEEEEEVPYEEQYWNHPQDANLTDNARPYRIVYHLKRKPRVSSGEGSAADQRASDESDKTPDQET